MAVTKTLVDTDTAQIVENKWWKNSRQFSTNVDSLYKHGTVNAALSNIGTAAQTTIVVTENTSVTANTDLTSYPNISWLFLGSGKLSPALGVTLTLYSADTIICPPEQQCLDASNGTIAFAKAGRCWPGWFGATPGASASAARVALQKLASALGSVGGTIYWPGRTIQVDDSITFTGPVTIEGEHMEASILETTADASLKHGLICTRSHTIRNLQIKTSSNLTENRQMYAIRCDLDGVTVSGGNLVAHYDHVKVRGFNNGIYLDGGDAYNFDRATAQDLDIKVSGPASDYVGSCVFINRVHQLYGFQNQLDQNSTGEHAWYSLGCKNVVLDGFKIRNHTRADAQAIKLVGNGVSPDDDQPYPTWAVRNMDIEDGAGGVLCSLYGTETLESLHIENCKFQDLTQSANVLGAVTVTTEDTASLRALLINNLSTRNLAYQGVHVAVGAGSSMGQITVMNGNAYNWGTASAGTYTWFGTNGTGTFGRIVVKRIEADGNSNGRTILGTAGQTTSITKLSYEDLAEVNTTDNGRPVALATGDATPSMAIGNDFTQGNGSAQNVTAYDHLAANQYYLVRYTTANTTLVDGASLNLAGSVNYNPPANAVVLFYSPDGTALWEVSRSAN